MALTKTEVSQLYISLFGRASEGSGNTYWQTQNAASADTNTNRTNTATEMLGLTIVKNYFGVTDYTTAANVQTVVESIYLNVLGKTYAQDTVGVDYWVAQVVAGLSMGRVVNDLIIAINHADNRVEVADLAASNTFNNKVIVSDYVADNISVFTDTATFRAYVSSVDNTDATVVAAKADALADVPVDSSSLTVTSHTDPGYELLTRKIDVFGIGIYAADGVAENKLIHAAHVLAEYLDNDEDGVVDNQLVVDAIIASKATIGLWKNEDDLDVITEGQRQFTMDLGDTETRPEWHVNNEPTAFDASLEEILHSITQNGYALVYPEIFGERTGTSVADAMDVARGGQFIEIPEQYPESAWYTYDDPSCDYQCMITEYMYWGLSSILGAQASRLDVIGQEWKLNTAELVETSDPTLYNLLTDDQYNFPTYLPDGNYTPDLL
jgi:hypothetical protein